MKKFLKRATLVVALALPAIAWAQGTNGGSNERPMFGNTTTCGACNSLGYQMCTPHFYVFWIDLDPRPPYPQGCGAN